MTRVQQRSFFARSARRHKLAEREGGEEGAAAVAQEQGQQDRKQQQRTIFRRFFPLFFTHFTQGVFITLPFILAAYMVRDLARQASPDAPPNEETLGRMIGLLGASFSGSQLLTSYLIGRLSDRIGRKPVMVVGNLSCIASATLFGLSGSYTMALLSRVLGGVFNAIIGAEKAILGEALSPVDQGMAFGYFSIAWGIGALAGPLIGGVFALPCNTLLSGTALCAEGSLLQRRPYLLPCLVTALFSVVATLLVVVGLEETLPRLCKGGAQQGPHYSAVPTAAPTDEEAGAAKGGGRAGSGVDRGRGAAEAPRKPGGGEVELGSVGPAAKQRGAEGAGAGEADEEGLIASAPGAGASTRQGGAGGAGLPRSAFSGDSAASFGDRVGPGAKAASGSSDGSSPRQEATSEQATWEEVDEELALLGQGGSSSAAGEAEGGGGLKAEVGAELAWWKQRSVVLALTGYGLIAFYYSMLDELVPIFASAPAGEGGLGLSTAQFAPSLTFGGFVLMAWALAGFPRLLRRYGSIKTCRAGLWSTPPAVLLFPVASLLGGSKAAQQGVLFGAMGLRGVAATNAFTSCIILVNSAAPPGSLGAVNGVGQTIASAVRAAAPALGGIAWGWSTSLSLPGHQFLPFACVAAVALGTLVVYYILELPSKEVVGTSGGRGAATAEAVATAEAAA